MEVKLIENNKFLKNDSHEGSFIRFISEKKYKLMSQDSNLMFYRFGYIINPETNPFNSDSNHFEFKDDLRLLGVFIINEKIKYYLIDIDLNESKLMIFAPHINQNSLIICSLEDLYKLSSNKFPMFLPFHNINTTIKDVKN